MVLGMVLTFNRNAELLMTPSVTNRLTDRVTLLGGIGARAVIGVLILIRQLTLRLQTRVLLHAHGTPGPVRVTMSVLRLWVDLTVVGRMPILTFRSIALHCGVEARTRMMLGCTLRWQSIGIRSSWYGTQARRGEWCTFGFMKVALRRMLLCLGTLGRVPSTRRTQALMPWPRILSRILGVVKPFEVMMWGPGGRLERTLVSRLMSTPPILFTSFRPVVLIGCPTGGL